MLNRGQTVSGLNTHTQAHIHVFQTGTDILFLFSLAPPQFAIRPSFTDRNSAGSFSTRSVTMSGQSAPAFREYFISCHEVLSLPHRAERAVLSLGLRVTLC